MKCLLLNLGRAIFFYYAIFYPTKCLTWITVGYLVATSLFYILMNAGLKSGLQMMREKNPDLQVTYKPFRLFIIFGTDILILVWLGSAGNFVLGAWWIALTLLKANFYLKIGEKC